MYIKIVNYYKITALLLLFVFLQQCCTYKETAQEKVKIAEKNYMNKISHGTAELSFMFSKIIENNGSYKVQGVVKKIYGYGSSIRPLAEGNNYEFDFDNNLFEKIKEKIGNSAKITISSTPQIMGSNELNKYKILSIEN